ncbi:MAG: histidine phosphotransferase family protein [Erythrobacter sp.]|jgi:histidine phosphotransferase ChpT|uniref:histidine phosphotransferase family protein n=1 Tax=Qipengyuania citrea TaxID=225971 RepID=UPI001A641F38|nr:histidine phosphotransferase family protein [Qipengyuania citrea]MBL4717954.1 histidine phosphotransferase [Erythrobacter sp.]MCP2017259.1 histidine phosphotransferase ChpT [Qipengyuania citrea]MDE0901361.1 histidine phosphotransferase family protein [Erythrobacter sp.]|tara:strand:- start:2225 stop:2884 length:660 start_codon:yes stop_codon:yes gene_type:complete
MDDRQSIDLAAMLCSRLCHDLLSPVGALSNGLELLAMESDAEMRANVMQLLEQSALISTNKLKFFRLAFGAAGGFGERVEIAEPKALIAALIADKPNITIEWALAEPTLGKPAVKVLLNFAQIAIDALVRGGTLDIGAEMRDGACEIVVRAIGPKIAFDDTIGKALDGSLDRADLTSRTAAAHMINLLATESGGGLQYHKGPDALVLGAVLPAGEGLIG